MYRENDNLLPLKWLNGVEHTYSFDLKSATDRWPLVLIEALLSSLFGPNVAAAVVGGGFGSNIFEATPPLTRRKLSISRPEILFLST